MMSYLLVAAGAPGPGGQSLLTLFTPMIIIFGIFYFLWFRPMQKKQKTLEATLAKLKKGDRVVTTGGFYGEVAKVEDNVVFLKLADNVKVRVSRRAIAGLEGSSADREGK